MATEVVLDVHAEDPVNIIRIYKEKTEKRKDKYAEDEEYEVDIYKVEHIIDGRGSPHVVKFWTIETDAPVD